MKFFNIFIMGIFLSGGAAVLAANPSTDEIIELLKSGQIKVTVSPNIDLSGIMNNVNVKDMAAALSAMMQSAGGRNQVKLFLQQSLRPLGQAFDSVVETAAIDLKNWYKNLVKPATYGDRVAQLRTIAYYGILAATVPAVGILMKRGADATIDIIKYKLMTPEPQIIKKDASPKYGRWDRVKRWWSGYQTPQLVFEPEVQTELDGLKNEVKNINQAIKSGDKKLTYRNILLYGPPGTGKTAFARALADYADMDFLPVTGETLQSKPSAFDDVVEMAKRSSYGAIIFIDEADALFLNRERLSQYDPKYILAVNSILATLGEPKNSYMVIAATNFPHVMDEAMNHRFPKQVMIPLPALQGRLAMLKRYIATVLFDEKSHSAEFVKQARLLLSDAFIEKLAQDLEGFSPSEMQNLIDNIRDATYRAEKRMITAEMISQAIHKAHESHKLVERQRATAQRAAAAQVAPAQ